MPLTWMSTKPGAKTTSPTACARRGASRSPRSATTPSCNTNQAPLEASRTVLATGHPSEAHAQLREADQGPRHATTDRRARRPELCHRHRHLGGDEPAVLG